MTKSKNPNKSTVTAPKPPQRSPIITATQSPKVSTPIQVAPPRANISTPTQAVTTRDNDQGKREDSGIKDAILEALNESAKANREAITALIEHFTDKTNKSGEEAAFLRTPLRSKTSEVLDLTTKEGTKYYERATKSLYDNGPKFDVDSANFFTFIELLNERVRDLGMLEEGSNLQMQFETRDDGEVETINPITQHGTYTLKEMQQWESKFLRTPTRNSQNSKILYDLLMNSLSTVGHQHVHNHKSEYTLKGMESGGCLFKVIVREAYVDSVATTNTVKESLTSLDQWLKDNGTDITKFNNYVLQQLAILRSRGERSQDITINLFKAYLSVKDKDFTTYIRQLRDKHEDGTQHQTRDTLMQFADKFYKTAITRKEWEKQSSQEKQVLALQTRINKLSKQNESTPSNRKGKKGKNNNGGNAANSNGNAADSQQQKAEKPNWLKNHVKPANAKLTDPKTWNNITWHFCSPETGGKCTGQWRTHKPSECKGLAKKDGTSSADNKRKASPMNIATANEAIAMKYTRSGNESDNSE